MMDVSEVPSIISFVVSDGSLMTLGVGLHVRGSGWGSFQMSSGCLENLLWLLFLDGSALGVPLRLRPVVCSSP